MDDQSTPPSAPAHDRFALGVPSLLETWKHQCTLLGHELDETNRELVACRKRIARLVKMHDSDQQRIANQQARILQLEAEQKVLREKLIAFTAKEASGRSAAIFKNAYTGQP